MHSCLVPDAQYDDDAVIERAIAGPDVEFHVARGRSIAAIDPAIRQKVDICLVWHEAPIDAPALNMLTNCRVIVRCGTGFDQIDIAAAGGRGVPVFNVPDYGTSEVADHAMALVLALCRGITTYADAAKADAAAGWNYALAPLVTRLRGRQFGIVGLGRIGTATAMRAAAFGYEVAFFDPYIPDGVEIALGVRRCDTLLELLAGSDVVSLHTPLTEDTRGMIGPHALAAVKPGAIIVNTSRGAVLDVAAALAFLADGRLGGLALDVLPNEPPARDDPVFAALSGGDPRFAGRLIVTPHAAWYSADARREMRERGMRTALRYLGSGSLRNCVNREFLVRDDHVSRVA